MTVHATSLQRQLHSAHIERQRRLGLLKTAAEKQAEREAEIQRRADAAIKAWRTKAAQEVATRKENWRASWRWMVFLASAKQRKEQRRKQLAAMGDELPEAAAFNVLLGAVAAKYGVTVADLKSPERFPRILMQARLEAYWTGRQQGYSLKRIGKMMGGRDHTTVLDGCRRYEQMRRAAISGGSPYKTHDYKYRPDLIITGDDE